MSASILKASDRLNTSRARIALIIIINSGIQARVKREASGK
jgi:hypothetical protein